jgi:hypothetical protein
MVASSAISVVTEFMVRSRFNSRLDGSLTSLLSLLGRKIWPFALEFYSRILLGVQDASNINSAANPDL